MRRMSPRTRSAIGAFLVATLLTAQARTTRAQDAYSCIDALTDQEVTYRLRSIEAHIAHHKQYSKLWWWGWLTVIGSAGLAYWTAFGVIPHEGDDHDYRMRRERLFINAAGATLLTTQLSVFAMTSAHSHRKLRKLPDGTPEERRVKLREATKLLERAAKRQSIGISPTAHVGGPVWAIGTGTYLAVRDHPTFFVASAYLMPLVISEARILTQPRASIYEWERYRAMACYGRSGYAIPATPERSRVEWDFGIGFGGVNFGFRF